VEAGVLAAAEAALPVGAAGFAVVVVCAGAAGFAAAISTAAMDTGSTLAAFRAAAIIARSAADILSRK
jgi:hypothetical protein